MNRLLAGLVWLLLLSVPPGTSVLAQSANSPICDTIKAASWTIPTDRIPMPGPRFGAVAVERSGDLWIFGGHNIHGGLSDIISVSPGARSTTPEGRIPVASWNIHGATTPTGIFLFGGDLHGHLSPNIMRLDAGAEKPVVTGARLPYGLAMMADAYDGHRVFLAGGQRGAEQSSADIFAFDPLVAKLEKVPTVLPARVRDMTGAWDGSRVVWAGGFDEQTGFVDDVLVFDPLTNLVSPTGLRLPSPRAGAAALRDGSSVLFFGGYGPAGPLAEVIRIDVASGSVSIDGLLPEPRSSIAVARLGETVYLVGGGTATRYDRTTQAAGDILVYDLGQPCPIEGNALAAVKGVVDQVPASESVQVQVGPAVSLVYSCGDAPCAVDAIARVGTDTSMLPYGVPPPLGPPGDAVYLDVQEQAVVGRGPIEVEVSMNSGGHSASARSLLYYDGEAWIELEAGAQIPSHASGEPDLEINSVVRGDSGETITARLNHAGLFALASPIGPPAGAQMGVGERNASALPMLGLIFVLALLALRRRS